jgi:ubiquinone/menaquinone biosynthesis C-methylase UbiE
MSSPRSFDRLARIYRGLEYVAFGPDLERARYAYLDRLRECRSILVLGEGDGRCLERLVRSAPLAHIDCLDLSASMLACAAARLAGTEAADRVKFQQADLLVTALPTAQYDAVVTLFFLDCFTAPQAEMIMGRIAGSLRPGALWLWADFALPASGYSRLRARLWLALLYAFFRWQTGLLARELPPVERFFAQNGFATMAESSFQRGLVHSAIWHRPEKTR